MPFSSLISHRGAQLQQQSGAFKHFYVEPPAAPLSQWPPGTVGPGRGCKSDLFSNECSPSEFPWWAAGIHRVFVCLFFTNRVKIFAMCLTWLLSVSLQLLNQYQTVSLVNPCGSVTVGVVVTVPVKVCVINANRTPPGQAKCSPLFLQQRGQKLNPWGQVKQFWRLTQCI